MSQMQIDSMMDQVEARAILAMRPYPPVDLPSTCSQLGGLPILPSDESWPRARDGTPLHFLARIDCSELPEMRGPLPKAGILQFFARIDDMDWEDEASDYARVLYAESRIGSVSSPPADLPPIQRGYHNYDGEMRLPDEPQTRIYQQWPLTFTSIRSWPMYPPTGETSGETFAAYCEAVERARAAEIVRTTGRPTNPLLRPEWGESTFNHEGKMIVTLPHKGLRTDEFPQATIIAERIARAMARLASEDVGRLRKALESGQKPTSRTDLERLLPDLDRVIRESLSWVRRAQSSGLDAPMEEADAKEYRDWLTDLGRDDRFEVGYLLSRALKRGMSYAVKYCGGSPKAAALVPPGYMNRLEGEHSLTHPDITGIYEAPPRRQIGAIHHHCLVTHGRPRISATAQPRTSFSSI